MRYVFLDRDGVLNRKLPEGAYVTDWAQFQWLPGAVEAVARMNRAGLTVILVSNQRGIALGRFTTEQLELYSRQHADSPGTNMTRGWTQSITALMTMASAIAESQILGSLNRPSKDFPQANADNSVVIGDSLSDIQAGQRLGMKTIFIEGEADRQKAGADAAARLADAVAGSLLQAVEMHLGLRVPIGRASDRATAVEHFGPSWSPVTLANASRVQSSPEGTAENSPGRQSWVNLLTSTLDSTQD